MSIFYCLYFWDSLNLEGQVPVFISSRNRVVQLYQKSTSCYDWRSVNQYVLVSSPLWNLCFLSESCCFLCGGALSDERSGLSLVSHCQQYLVHRHNFILFTFYMSHMFYDYTVYTKPLSAQAQYSRSCIIICSLRYNSLDTWTVVRLTVAKFKPLIFSVLGFALSYVANICIFMILYDFCLLPALYNSRTGMRLGKLPVVRRTLFCRRCNFNRWESAANTQVGEA
jgi:hypothetical protein